MKKFLKILGLIGLIGLIIVVTPKAHADEVEEYLTRNALLGEELDRFEENEQQQAKLKRLSKNRMDEIELRTKYEEYKALGVLEEDVTFELFTQLATSEPPTDPVAPEFRNARTKMYYGDILITNDTSFWGVTGHAGIYLGSVGKNQILSIEGSGRPPKTMSVLDWESAYGKKGTWTKIYRVAEQYQPRLAARWALDNYDGKNYKYGITTNIFGMDPTYCSKIVWQAYWYASAAVQVGGMYQPLIALPYDLPDYFDERAIHILTWEN
ncbi:YiiX/YebB-like N1pC/P60 family cysteine hydrolase [Enterococcus faecium]|uniref:Uncharacterized protein n=4 Tax=Enterococcus TaxID=1350 RepID=A0A7V7GPY5_ENTFC|nr:YiiX/YebB-like N1pC/P60 family cysteine hydrolase [Enterococcus faecium]KAA0690438.1 hypothetical protein DTX73_08965 [Enterococcus faecium]MBK5027578.1 hypothetical protein [Enterococcus faecium]MBK5038077.1 hypothetical protein [Enterococcus faecium]MBK5043077.1 hypothetical protein [Enterococcus faecium]MBK5068243.1 hypothetical protein [Enterococcus faecium]